MSTGAIRFCGVVALLFVAIFGVACSIRRERVTTENADSVMANIGNGAGSLTQDEQRLVGAYIARSRSARSVSSVGVQPPPLNLTVAEIIARQRVFELEHTRHALQNSDAGRPAPGVGSVPPHPERTTGLSDNRQLNVPTALNDDNSRRANDDLRVDRCRLGMTRGCFATTSHCTIVGLQTCMGGVWENCNGCCTWYRHVTRYRTVYRSRTRYRYNSYTGYSEPVTESEPEREPYDDTEPDQDCR